MALLELEAVFGFWGCLDWISFDDPMAPTDAQYSLPFIAFDCPVYPCAVLVTNLCANVRYIDRWLLAGCEPMPYPSVITVHVS